GGRGRGRSPGDRRVQESRQTDTAGPCAVRRPAVSPPAGPEGCGELFAGRHDRRPRDRAGRAFQAAPHAKDILAPAVGLQPRRDRGFPPGQLTGPNSRTWDEAEVLAWLDSRPTGPKPAPSRALEAA